eukprot:SAG31_NODE_2910_length_4916_cov_3.526545_4_plen_187_part_00
MLACCGAPARNRAPEPECGLVEANRYQLKIGKYLLGTTEDLGKGGFGIVAEGVNVSTGEAVAIKIAMQQQINNAEELKEVVLQAGLIYKHIVPIKDICYAKLTQNGAFTGRPRLDQGLQLACHRETKILAIVMEILEGGTMFELVVAKNGLSEPKARLFFREILLAMAYCHGRGVAHRCARVQPPA